MPKYKIDDKVITTVATIIPLYKINNKVVATEYVEGTGIIIEVKIMPTTKNIRYHVDFKDTNESGWFREEELKPAMPKLDSDGMAIGVGKLW